MGTEQYPEVKKKMSTTRNLNDAATKFNPERTEETNYRPVPQSYQIGGNHYRELSVEPWAAMDAWLTTEEFIGFLRGNIIKYHARAQTGKGDPHENMRKANHYSQKLEQVLGTFPERQKNEDKVIPASRCTSQPYQPL